MAYDRDSYKPQESEGRTLGEKNAISVGTAIALESITFEEHDFEVMFFNITTAFRNFYGSWNNQNRPNMETLLPLWIEELETIKALIESMGIPLIYYKPDYNTIEGFWPDARFKNPRKITEQQKKNPTTLAKRKQLLNAERVAVNVATQAETLTIYGTGLFLPKIRARTVLISHQVVDLLAVDRFDDLVLLETHTAELKEFGDFNTKLNTDNPRIGFNHFNLCVYGDKGGKLVRPLGIKFTKAIDKLSEDKRWNTSTTYAKMESDISNNLEKELAVVLRRILLKKPALGTPIVLE